MLGLGLELGLEMVLVELELELELGWGWGWGWEVTTQQHAVAGTRDGKSHFDATATTIDGRQRRATRAATRAATTNDGQ